MRFMRVVSLVAGITLLVTGLAGLLGRRAEVGRERDQRLESSAELVTAQLDATIARITASMAVATPATPVEQLADALAMPVCAVADGGAARCSASSSELAPDAAVTTALDAAAGEPTPVVLVTPPRGSRGAAGILVAADQGERTLLAATALETGDLPPGTAAVLVPVDGEPLLRPRTAGDVRAFAAPSMVEFEGGPWAVRTTTRAAVHLTADERWLIGAQLAVGAVLAALALGGMFVDHRSLQRRATTDALTRLPNRAEFERRATEVLGRLGRDGGSACLMVIDLDQFKVVNDTVGHEAGDRALVAAAERLRQAVRSSDVVGRWGGDEFVVLLPGVADARSVPERAATIANAIAAAPPIGGYELTASVGAALFPAHASSLEGLLRTADRAMYAAKVGGLPHHLAESGF
jgi:diguanylate cyclase (GGDEF)-like protein